MNISLSPQLKQSVSFTVFLSNTRHPALVLNAALSLWPALSTILFCVLWCGWYEVSGLGPAGLVRSVVVGDTLSQLLSWE